MNGLRVEALRRKISTFTLEASFELARGERAGVVGPSGSGKTTLLRLLAGLEPADSGRIWIDGVEVTGHPARERGIGYVFQEQALFPALDVLSNAAFGLAVRGMARAEREREARIWLDKVGLGPRARSSVQELSGGERQRVAFVRALIWRPKLLLFDEPFSALDKDARDGMRRELLALHRGAPVPMLFVSHDSSDVDALATKRLKLESDSGGATRRVL